GRLESLSPGRFVFEAARIVALAGDGHTRVEFERTPAWQRTLPVRLRHFADGLFVVAAAPPCRELAGRRVVRIGARDADAPGTDARKVVSADVGEAAAEISPLTLVARDALELLGAAPAEGPVEITTALADGSLATTRLDATVPGGPPLSAPVDWTIAGPPA